MWHWQPKKKKNLSTKITSNNPPSSSFFQENILFLNWFALRKATLLLLHSCLPAKLFSSSYENIVKTSQKGKCLSSNLHELKKRPNRLFSFIRTFTPVSSKRSDATKNTKTGNSTFSFFRLWVLDHSSFSLPRHLVAVSYSMLKVSKILSKYFYFISPQTI